MGELELIDRIRAGAGDRLRRGVALGIGDDCAILHPPRGHEIVVTTDFTLEGRHFRRDRHSPESVGHRVLARGLSDIAAMGAEPLAAFLSLALPPEMPARQNGRAWVDGFFRGLKGLGDRMGVSLAGGDTSESPCGLVLADIVLVGSALAGRALRRSGGKPGDSVYVTGELGGAAAELERLLEHPGPHRQRWAARSSRSHREGRVGPRGSAKAGSAERRAAALRHPQLWPQPRVAVGRALLRRGLASACMDLSDGLSTDLAHLCRASRVGAEIEASALPIHPLALHTGAGQALQLALNGGEDYELLFTASPAVRMPRSVAGVAVTRIGRLVRGREVTLIGADGASSRLEPHGWEHFGRAR